jgi:hypothetical protein
MQTKSAVYAFASVIPSILIKEFGLSSTYYISSLLCTTSVLGAAGEYIYVYTVTSNDGIIERQLVPPTERSPLTGRNRSHSQTSLPSKNLYTRSSFSFRGSAVFSDSSRPVNIDDAIVSTELLTLEVTLDAMTKHPHPIDVSTGNYDDVDLMSPTEVVQNVLDATEYCVVSEEMRRDPTFEPEINRTLAFATPRIVEGLTQISSGPAKAPAAFICPTFVKYILSLLMFTDLGLASSISGWLPTYVSMAALDSPVDGTSVVSVYFGCAAVGCLLSVPLAVCLSTSTLLRAHLSLVVVAVLLLCLIYSDEVAVLCASAGLFGYALSAVIPLALTMVNDYGYTM